MARKNNSKRLYQKGCRFYVDFRDFRDFGGGQEALIPPGERYATTDKAVALKLAKARLKELKAARKRGPVVPGVDLALFGDFMDYHLECERAETDRPDASMARLDQQLNVALAFFGAGKRLPQLSTVDMQEYLKSLSERGGPDLQAKYLSAVSKMLRRARASGIVPMSHDPIRHMMNKPKRKKSNSDWMEAAEAALMLEAARLYRPRRGDLGISYAYPLIAFLLLTGVRPAEGTGLEVTDLNFDRNTIRIRPNSERPLKNDGADRTIPMWPQLKEILLAYMFGAHAPSGRFLFPSPKNPNKPIRNIKGLIGELSLRIGRETPATPKIFRHTYCAARLQTVDGAYPISEYTVSEEMGHGSTDMVRRIYRHLGKIYARGESVEFRLEHFTGQVAGMLEALTNSSQERNAYGVNLANRVAPEVEHAVIRAGLDTPALGSRKIAAVLVNEGTKISASGVHWIWKRHKLERTEMRIEARRTGRFADMLAAS